MKAKKKTKAKPRRKSRTRSVGRSVPLVAETAEARKSKPFKARTTPAPLANTSALNPAVAMLEFMQRVTAAYVELPSRLIQCRSMMDIWREQARFAQRILSVTEAPRSQRRPRRFQQE